MFSLLLAVRVFAWGSEGHNAVGTVAMGLVTEDVRSYLKNLMPQYLGNLAPATTWADEVKNSNEWRYTNVFHYVDISVAPPKECRYDDKTDCPDNKCIVGAIYNNTVLASCDANGSPSPLQEIAVKFLAHFIGDITQPLHACGRQRGGNDAKAPYDGRESQLHGIWDYEMIQTKLPILFNGDQNKWADDLVRRIKSGEFDTKSWVTDTDIFATSESKNSAVAIEWVTETNGLNCGTVWGDYDADMTQDFSKGYTDKHWSMVELQVAKGGYRLADMLNKLLSKCNPLPTPPPSPENEVIAVSKVSMQSFDCKKTECAMGNLIADCMISETDADVSMMNAGGIRSSLITGDVTVGMVKTISPFDNKVVVREIVGERLKALLVRIFASSAKLGRFPQFGGIRFKHDKDTGVVSDITVNGQPLDLTKTYKFASLDFIWTGGEGIFDAPEKVTGPLTGPSSRDSLVSCIKKAGVITAVVDNRLGFKKDVSSTVIPSATAVSTAMPVVTVSSALPVTTGSSVVQVTTVSSVVPVTTASETASVSQTPTVTDVPVSTVSETSIPVTTVSETTIPVTTASSKTTVTTASSKTTVTTASSETTVAVASKSTAQVSTSTIVTTATEATTVSSKEPVSTECSTSTVEVTTTETPKPTEPVSTECSTTELTTELTTETPKPEYTPVVTSYAPSTPHYSDVPAPVIETPLATYSAGKPTDSDTYDKEPKADSPAASDKPEVLVYSNANTAGFSVIAILFALF